MMWIGGPMEVALQWIVCNANTERRRAGRRGCLAPVLHVPLRGCGVGAVAKGAAPGPDVPVLITQDGIASNTVTIAVQ